jgi:hypothetical protein
VAFVACAAEVQHARKEVVPAGHHVDLLFEAELGEQLTSDGVDLRIGERLAGLERAECAGLLVAGRSYGLNIDRGGCHVYLRLPAALPPIRFDRS